MLKEYMSFFINRRAFSIVLTLAFIIIFIFYILFAKIDIVSSGTGVITGSNDKIDIVSPDPGFVSVFNLKTGESVHKGQLLFSYVNLDSFYREKTLNELVSFSERNVRKVSDNLVLLKKLINPDAELPYNETYAGSDAGLSAYKFYHEKLELAGDEENYLSRIDNIKKNIDNLNMQKNTLEQKNALLKKSAAPAVELLNNSAEISKIQSQIIEANFKILDIENVRKKQRDDFYNRLLGEIVNESKLLSEQKKDILKNTGEMELLRNKVKSNSVLSPVDGVILDITQNLTNGSYIEPSQLVMKIKKDKVDRLIDARFDARYRPFIFKGAKVRIVINSPGYRRYYEGFVSKISVDSFIDKDTPGMRRFYKVEIQYDKEKQKVPEYNEGIQVSVY
ncbi:HlyD family efflux transporter periplasmic adaptor subunit, partial [Salmonella enterica]|nr:HlyD family efflux transporter periplasmic adaptor subunit [Salmonella enterica]EGA6237648.1 HlyD family efflux transporter periplasmic adaptor subunit [Salmonella enterica]